MIGVSLDLGAPITIGYRAIHTRFFYSVGGTVEQLGPREFWLDWGLAAEIGASARGTLTHEVGAAQSFVYSPHNAHWYSYRDSSLRVFYGMRIEAGPVYVRLQTGAAYNGRVGPHISAGVGWVRR
jgi:hypothetical protein